jgi:outer membrane protein
MSKTTGRWTKVVFFGVLVATLAGCTTWSGDVAKYRQLLDGPPATRPDYSADDPLPLSRALELANADNEAIASRGENYVQALAEKMRQAGTFLPTVTLAPSYSFTGNTHQTSVPLNASATGSLSQASSIQAAEYTAQERAQELLNERESILLQVAQAYYSVLTYERQAEVYANSVKVKTEKVRDQQERMRIGNARALDLAQSQADLAGTRVILTQTRTNAANARSALARLMGVSAVKGPLVDGLVLPQDIPTLDQWQSSAESSRQDLRAAAQALTAAQANLDAAIRQYYPSLTLNFSYLLHSDPSSMQSWTSVLSANLPLFSALAIEADIRKNWSYCRQAELVESQTRRQVVDEVNQSYQNLQSSQHNIADLQIQVETAQRAADLAERAYELGSVANLDRLIQQDNLLTAQLNLLSQQLGEKQHYLALLRSAGEITIALPKPH